MASQAILVTKNRIDVKQGTDLYARLRQKVVAEGILDRSYSYYAFITLIALIGFSVSLYQFTIATAPLTLAIWTVLFVVFAVQMAGLIHDAGHRAIFNSSKINDFFAQVFCTITVMGYSYWKTKHNTHHAQTNILDSDPDIDIPLLTFTTEHAAKRSKVERFILRYQAYLYYPLGLFSLFYFRWLSIRYFQHNFSLKLIPEILLFTLGILVWFIGPFLLFDPAKAILFIVASNLLIGLYLMNIFAPNHKGMPQVAQGVQLSFVEHQVMTSRNVTTGGIYDIIYLGLNYQIEHHLFPNCPRNKLHRITPHLLEICKEMNLEYTKVGIIESNKIILSELNQIALAAKQ